MDKQESKKTIKEEFQVKNRIFEYTYSTERLLSLKEEEEEYIKELVNSGKNKTKTSIRLKNTTLWKLELISRLAKREDIKNYKNFGDIIEMFADGLLGDITRKEVTPGMSLKTYETSTEIIFEQDETEKLHKNIHFLSRVFMDKNEEHKEISLADLTFHENFILRSIALYAFEPSLLSKFELELLLYVASKCAEYQSSFAIDFINLNDPQTSIKFDELYFRFGSNPLVRDIQILLKYKSGIASLLPVKEEMVHEGSKLNLDEIKNAERKRRDEVSQSRTHEVEKFVKDAKYFTEFIRSLLAKVGKIKLPAE